MIVLELSTDFLSVFVVKAGQLQPAQLSQASGVLRRNLEEASRENARLQQEVRCHEEIKMLRKKKTAKRHAIAASHGRTALWYFYWSTALTTATDFRLN